MSNEIPTPRSSGGRLSSVFGSTARILAILLPVVVCLPILSACSGGNAMMGGQKYELQPLQEGQPPQKPGPEMVAQFAQMAQLEPIQGGQPGNVPISFKQPFRLGNLEYQFIGSTGKKFVGLAESPSMQAAMGSAFFVVRYMVTNRGDQPVVVPNNVAVHLYELSSQRVIDIDPKATNANIVSGAATGLPESLELAPGVANIQTLVYKVPSRLTPEQLTVLVTEPSNPNQLFQQVKLSN